MTFLVSAHSSIWRFCSSSPAGANELISQISSFAGAAAAGAAAAPAGAAVGAAGAWLQAAKIGDRDASARPAMPPRINVRRERRSTDFSFTFP